MNHAWRLGCQGHHRQCGQAASCALLCHEHFNDVPDAWKPWMQGVPCLVVARSPEPLHGQLASSKDLLLTQNLGGDHCHPLLHSPQGPLTQPKRLCVPEDLAEGPLADMKQYTRKEYPWEQGRRVPHMQTFQLEGCPGCVEWRDTAQGGGDSFQGTLHSQADLSVGCSPEASQLLGGGGA